MYVLVNNQAYIGEYNSTQDIAETPDNQQCTFYNETAKKQIIDALSSAYPAL